MSGKIILSNEKSDAVMAVAGRSIPVRIQRYARANSYRLRLDSDHQLLRLSIPQRGSVRSALDWARSQTTWIEAQLASAVPRVSLAPASVLPFEGREICLQWSADGPRSPRLQGDVLMVGGPAEAFGRRVLRWLKSRASVVLSAETHDVAEGAGLTVSRVAVADPRSRWGSCSASGVIRYSWRLIMAPPDVRRAIVAHEVAHLRHMDHSAAFHAFHTELLGEDPAYAHRWLRQHGRELHRIGL